MTIRRMFVVFVAAVAVLMTTGSTGAVGSTVVAVPLSSPTPAWYTPELRTDVVEAATRGEGVALPAGAEADIPASGLAFTGIRPGSWMLFPAGCTLNFVFGSPGNYAIGTPATARPSARR